MVPVLDVKVGDSGYIFQKDVYRIGTSEMIRVKLVEHTHNRGVCEEHTIFESRVGRDLRLSE